ncbi:MAG TPA: IPT/TIG domain-containing protein, partial [Pirellulales bacterium]|nr:IPT/TIG domain-containing protein [Pirellulales bacterium]
MFPFAHWLQFSSLFSARHDKRMNGAGRRRCARGRAGWARRWPLHFEELESRRLLTLLGQQLFPADNPWNQNISNAPVVANSAAIISHIGTSVRIHPDWGEDNPANGTDPLYGIPVNVVHGNSTAKINVIIDNYPDESDIVGVPIPAGAVLEGDYQVGPNPNGGGYNANQRGDSHLIIWDEDNNIAYELYGVTRPSDPKLFPNNNGAELNHTDGQWHAAQETVWNMNTDSFRTLGATSADAAGLSILAGLARPDEGLPVSQGGQGVINHALRMTLPSGDINPQYVYPASHMVSTSQGANNVPLGARLRLASTPTINNLINNMPPESQIIARAMQQYGLIVADIGSAMYVTGASAAVDANNNIALTWNTDDIFASNGLEALNAGDFQVVNLAPVVTGLNANRSAAGSTLTVTGQNFSGAAGHLSVTFGATAATSVTVVSDTQLSVVVPRVSGTVDVRVQSGVDETDNISDNPNANVNAPIFGYGTSAKTSADLYTEIAPGDFNADGHVDADDMMPAMQALTNPTTYMSTYGVSSGNFSGIADVNGDGHFDSADLQALLSMLHSGKGSSSEENSTAATAAEETGASAAGTNGSTISTTTGAPITSGTIASGTTTAPATSPSEKERVYPAIAPRALLFSTFSIYTTFANVARMEDEMR